MNEEKKALIALADDLEWGYVVLPQPHIAKTVRYSGYTSRKQYAIYERHTGEFGVLYVESGELCENQISVNTLERAKFICNYHNAFGEWPGD